MARVLVVDDDPLVCWSLERTLSREGYEVTALDSAEKVLADVEAIARHVAIVDVVLPEMDGLGTDCDKMRSAFPGLKAIVITGHGSREVQQRAVEQGVFANGEKPFSVEELNDVVKTVAPSPDIAQLSTLSSFHQESPPRRYRALSSGYPDMM